MATRLTLPNPSYQEALRMGRWTGNIEPTLSLYERLDDDMAVPWWLKFSLPTGTVIDGRTETHPARFEWMGPELRDYQEHAVQAALEAGGGGGQAPTGSGKTFLALNLIAKLGQKTLVLVRNKDLAAQWLTEIHRVLGIEAGLIGAGKRTDGEIVVGLMQTVSTQSPHGFGCVVLDEAHNAPAWQAFDILNRTTARYRVGLTATPQRRDGLEPMLFAAFGPVVAEIREEDVGRKGVLPVTVVTREMPYCGGQVDSLAKLCSELAADPARNRMIVNRL